MPAARERHPRRPEDFVVGDLPATVYYIPDFLSLSICQLLLQNIQSTASHVWTKLAHRRLLAFPSQLTGKNRDTLVAGLSSLPPYLVDDILPKFGELGIFADSPHGAPNHILVNEYLPGQGIMPHEDGSAYHPVVATVSLGGSIVLDIYSKSSPDGGQHQHQQHWRVLQEPGSLLVTTGECYTHTIHGIAEIRIDDQINASEIANWHLLANAGRYTNGVNVRTTRVSLTYRDVKKVVKCGVLGQKG